MGLQKNQNKEKYDTRDILKKTKLNSARIEPARKDTPNFKASHLKAQKKFRDAVQNDPVRLAVKNEKRRNKYKLQRQSTT